MWKGLILDFNSYQEKSRSTAIYNSKYAVMYPAMGLGGEAGEVLNKVKKLYRDQDGVILDEDRETLISELGDCLWYIAQLASDLGIQLDTVAHSNLYKLQDRKERSVLQGSGDNR